MSSISSLNVGLKALLAAQSALDTAGHNVANVTTPGY
jgi:flagellar hook-associated protein 1 FlgK